MPAVPAAAPDRIGFERIDKWFNRERAVTIDFRTDQGIEAVFGQARLTGF